MKSYATPFAIAGALLIAALLAVTNLITTPSVLWFICPAVGLIGWPAGVWLCRRKSYKAFSVVTSVLLIAFLAALNWVTSPQTLWFPYAAPLILFWPLGMLLRGNIMKLPFALLLGVLVTAYCLAINLLLTPGYFWAHHAIFAMLWWPLGLYFSGRSAFKKFSVAGALLIIAYLIVCNLLSTPYPWALYACFPVVGWPLAMFLGKRIGAFRFSLLGSIITLVWYGALNLLLEPGSPWIIFIAFALLWWPLSVFFHGRRKPHIYAVVMSVLSIAFLLVINSIYSPGAIWAVYPAFALLWWPITLLFAYHKAWRAYSVAASLMTIIFLAAVNLMTSPGFLWCVFPTLSILWWPLAMAFKGKRHPFGFALSGAVLSIATLLIINLMTSPGFLWCVFPALCILWWPAAVLFAGKKSALGFSVAGSLLIIALVSALNFMTSPGFLWCVFPIFGVLWWPLSVFFHGARRRRLAGSKA
jgi:hypothetical protein